MRVVGKVSNADIKIMFAIGSFAKEESVIVDLFLDNRFRFLPG